MHRDGDHDPGIVSLNSDGTIPNSSTIADFASGSYSYQASYSGDGDYAASGPGACEPLSVEMSTATVDTTVDDAATNNPWSGTEKAGASAYDTSTVTGVAGIAPTGTISYTFWANGTCANSRDGGRQHAESGHQVHHRGSAGSRLVLVPGDVQR